MVVRRVHGQPEGAGYQGLFARRGQCGCGVRQTHQGIGHRKHQLQVHGGGRIQLEGIHGQGAGGQSGHRVRFFIGHHQVGGAVICQLDGLLRDLIAGTGINTAVGGVFIQVELDPSICADTERRRGELTADLTVAAYHVEGIRRADQDIVERASDALLKGGAF